MTDYYRCRHCKEVFSEDDIVSERHTDDCGYYGEEIAYRTYYELYCPHCHRQEFDEIYPDGELDDLINENAEEWLDENDNVIVDHETIKEAFWQKYGYDITIKENAVGTLYVDYVELF